MPCAGKHQKVNDKRNVRSKSWLVRQFGNGTVVVPEELHEHQVPNLQDVWVVHVHQLACVSSADAVEMKLAADLRRTKTLLLYYYS